MNNKTKEIEVLIKPSELDELIRNNACYIVNENNANDHVERLKAKLIVEIPEKKITIT